MPLSHYLLESKALCNKVGCGIKKQTKGIQNPVKQRMSLPNGYACLATDQDKNVSTASIYFICNLLKVDRANLR